MCASRSGLFSWFPGMSCRLRVRRALRPGVGESFFFLFLGMSLSLSSIAAELSVHAVTPDRIQWREIRKVPSLLRATIHGDLDQPGSFTFRVRAAAGHRLMPHTHPDDRTITVLEGTYWTGLGERWNESALAAFPRGSFFVVPAGVPHFSAVLEGEAEIQESGWGPSRNDMLSQKQ